jgi:hypothetical protein
VVIHGQTTIVDSYKSVSNCGKRVRTATSVFSFRTSFVMGLVSWVLSVITTDHGSTQHSYVSTHAACAEHVYI